MKLALLTAACLVSCERASSRQPIATERPPEAEGPGFVIQVPKGYEDVTDDFENVRTGGGVALGATVRVDGFLSSIVVIPTATPVGDPSTHVYCEQIAQALPMLMPDVDLVRHQRVELPFGRTCQYEVAKHDRPTEGAIGTVMYKGDHGWVVTCNLALSDDRARAACDQVLRTWKFRD